MNFFKIMLLVLLGYAALPTEMQDYKAEVPKEFQTEYNRFMYLYQTHCNPKFIMYPKSLKIRFVDTFGADQPKRIGECWNNPQEPYGDKLILIKKEKWEISSQATRAGLLYHELTHCILNFHAHDEDPSSYFAPALPIQTLETYERQTVAKILEKCGG